MPHANQTPQAVSYFNLHTHGIGYLNRIREVPIRRGQPFLACNIAALHGAANAVEYTRFDCKVTGAEAHRQHAPPPRPRPFTIDNLPSKPKRHDSHQRASGIPGVVQMDWPARRVNIRRDMTIPSLVVKSS